MCLSYFYLNLTSWLSCNLKGKFSQNDNSVIIYSPSCYCKPVWVFLLLNPKEDILKNVGYQKVDGSHWLPWYGGKKLCWSQWVPSTKKKIFWRKGVTKKLTVAIDFHDMVGEKILWKSMGTINQKEDILKTVRNQKVDGSHWLPWYVGKKYCGSQWVPSTKKKIFWRLCVTKKLTVAIDFHDMGGKNTVGFNGYHQPKRRYFEECG